jgi:hypothetical protein
VKSAVLPSFWSAYEKLEPEVKQRARKAFRLWNQNPFHPSLHFKCVNETEGLWSVRITLSHRALSIVEGDTATWFWIGGHAQYERFLA